MIYPGALIKGESILDGSYLPIPVKRKPITISTSLQGADKVSVVVDDPKLSTVREAANSLMKQDYDVPPANLGFTIESVYNKQQLNLALHAGYQSGIMDVNGSFNYSDTKIHSRVVAKFIQVYYTLDMDIPSQPSDLIDGTPTEDMFGSLMPMYISTVTFGRMALFTVESELSDTEVKTYLQASYDNVSGDASTDFDKLMSKSTMKVYVLGGSGADAGTAINGFADFKKYISQGGNFSKTSPGAPISYKLRYINDNTIAKVVFAASYPVRTAIPRTDNLRYNVSVYLHGIKPQFADGDGSANEFFGYIRSWTKNNPNTVQRYWTINDGGTYLVVAKNKTYYFPVNTTTKETYTNLTGDDQIVFSIHIHEKDTPPFDPDDDLGQIHTTVNLSSVIANAPGPYNYTITNYGQGSAFMNLYFVIQVEAINHI